MYKPLKPLLMELRAGLIVRGPGADSPNDGEGSDLKMAISET